MGFFFVLTNLHSISLSTTGSTIGKHSGIVATENTRNQRANFPVKDLTHTVVLLAKERVQPITLVSATPKSKTNP